MMKFVMALCLLLIITHPAQARPISYPGGVSFMIMNDSDGNALHLFYTPAPSYSFGPVLEYMQGPDAHMAAVQGNYLVKRWNSPDSQANFYLKGGVGAATKNNDMEPALYAGMAADWENRRLLTSYENRALWADDIDHSIKHTGRVGVAPYIGDYGDLHTWLMLQADYDTGKDDHFSVTPLVRVFKGTTLLEAGYNLDGGILFNIMHTF